MTEPFLLPQGHTTVRAETDMDTRQRHDSESLPIENYSAAIAKAVEWLGDRYLLAKPVNAVRAREASLATLFQRESRPADM